MQLSSTAKTLMRKKSGWRNDVLFDNKNFPFAATISYELEVLGNTDIISFVLENYFAEEYKRDKNNFYGVLYSDYLRNGKSIEELLSYYDHNMLCVWFSSYFSEKMGMQKTANLYCKWFTTVEGYNKVYMQDDVSYELLDIWCYSFPAIRNNWCRGSVSVYCDIDDIDYATILW